MHDAEISLDAEDSIVLKIGQKTSDGGCVYFRIFVRVIESHKRAVIAINESWLGPDIAVIELNQGKVEVRSNVCPGVKSK